MTIRSFFENTSNLGDLSWAAGQACDHGLIQGLNSVFHKICSYQISEKAQKNFKTALKIVAFLGDISLCVVFFPVGLYVEASFLILRTVISLIVKHTPKKPADNSGASASLLPLQVSATATPVASAIAVAIAHDPIIEPPRVPKAPAAALPTKAPSATPAKAEIPLDPVKDWPSRVSQALNTPRTLRIPSDIDAWIRQCSLFENFDTAFQRTDGRATLERNRVLLDAIIQDLLEGKWPFVRNNLKVLAEILSFFPHRQ